MSATAGPAHSRLPRRHLFQLAGRRVPSYTAMLYLGCTAGVYAGAAVGSSAGLDAASVAFATIALLVPALAGSRLLYVLQHLDRYRAQPSRVWLHSDGGAALYGGLVMSVALSVPLLALWSLPFWAFWDAASVTMLVGLIFTRVGCVLNGCCAGRPTSGPFGMRLPGRDGTVRRRFPTQLLEAGWAAIVLAAALAVLPLPSSGSLFAAVVAAYAVGRLLLERIREGDGPKRVPAANLVLSVGLLVAACAVLLAGLAG